MPGLSPTLTGSRGRPHRAEQGGTTQLNHASFLPHVLKPPRLAHPHPRLWRDLERCLTEPAPFHLRRRSHPTPQNRTHLARELAYLRRASAEHGLALSAQTLACAAAWSTRHDHATLDPMAIPGVPRGTPLGPAIRLGHIPSVLTARLPRNRHRYRTPTSAHAARAGGPYSATPRNRNPMHHPTRTTWPGWHGTTPYTHGSPSSGTDGGRPSTGSVPFAAM
jgi:hypothetical protein